MQDIEELALKLFSESKITISEAAEIAHLSLGEIMELLSARGVKSKITLEDYEKGLFNAEEALKSCSEIQPQFFCKGISAD